MPDPHHAQIVGFLRRELGFHTAGGGRVGRQIQENSQMLRDIETMLRGRGDELGLIGWMMVLRRSWITLVALLGAALGYFLNDVVDALERGGPPRAAVQTTQRP